jgi:hypothetical protein
MLNAATDAMGTSQKATGIVIDIKFLLSILGFGFYLRAKVSNFFLFPK